MKSDTKNTTQPNNTGFTIIELLIATAAFSLVLLAVLASFIQISRMYYKGVNISSTQNDARNITQSIEDDIKFASTSPDSVSASGGTASGSFCISGHRYAYFLGKHVGYDSPAGIYRENLAGCPPLPPNYAPPSTADQMLDSGMELNHIGVGCQNGRCNINILLVFYGGDPNGLFGSISGFNPAYQAADAQCKGALTSSQFCVSTYYRRTVLQHI